MSFCIVMHVHFITLNRQAAAFVSQYKYIQGGWETSTNIYRLYGQITLSFFCNLGELIL